MNQEAATIFVRTNAERTQEKHPSHKLSVIVKKDIPAGTKLYGAIWPKMGDDGSQYWSGQIEFPQERQQSNQLPHQGQRSQVPDRRPSNSFGDDRRTYNTEDTFR